MLQVLVKFVSQVLEPLIPQQIGVFRDIVPLWHGYREGVRALLPEDPLEVARIVHFVCRAEVAQEDGSH
jgi:hypothetical protein